MDRIPKLLASKKEAAYSLGVSLRAVDYKIASGELPTRRIGRRVLVPVTALQKFARQDHTDNLAAAESNDPAQ